MRTITEPVTTWCKRIECAGCHAVLEAITTDLRSRMVDRWQRDGYGDGGDYVKTKEFYVICPHCDTIAIIEDTELSLALRKKLGAKA
jgi:hypothetical protein